MVEARSMSAIAPWQSPPQEDQGGHQLQLCLDHRELKMEVYKNGECLTSDTWDWVSFHLENIKF